MTKEKLKKELSSCSKDEIIDSVLYLYDTGFYNTAVLRLLNVLEDKKEKEKDKLIDAANKEWEKASKALQDFIKSLVKEKGTPQIKLTDLSPQEVIRYNKLLTAELKTWDKLLKLQSNNPNFNGYFNWETR